MNIATKKSLEVILSAPEKEKGFLLILKGLDYRNQNERIKLKIVEQNDTKTVFYFEERKNLERFLRDFRNHLFYSLSPQKYEKIKFNATSPNLKPFLILLDRVFIYDPEFLLLIFVDIILSTNLWWVLYQNEIPYSGINMVETLLREINKRQSLVSNVETVIANHPLDYLLNQGYSYLTQMGSNVVNVLNILQNTKCSPSFSKSVLKIISCRTVSDEEEALVLFLPFPLATPVNDTPENGVFNPDLLKYTTPNEYFLEILLENSRENFYELDENRFTSFEDSSLVLKSSLLEHIKDAIEDQGLEVTSHNYASTAVLVEHLLASHARELLDQNKIYLKKVDDLSAEEMLRILPVILQAGDGNCYVIVTSYNTL